MRICPDCLREIWDPDSADDPDDLGFCECPSLKIRPYAYSEEDDPEEVT